MFLYLKTARMIIEPKTPDWSPEIEEETGGSGSVGPRRKTDQIFFFSALFFGV